MRLSAKLIKNYANVNSFSYMDQWIIRAGEPSDLYFQLIDLDQNGIRYLAGIGSGNQPVVVQVTFPSIDDAAVLLITATQPDANDSSIWKVSILATQTPNSGNVIFSIAEGAVTRSFGTLNLLSVEFPGSDGSC